MKGKNATVVIAITLVIAVVPQIATADMWLYQYWNQYHEAYQAWRDVINARAGELVEIYDKQGDLTDDEITELSACVIELLSSGYVVSVGLGHYNLAESGIPLLGIIPTGYTNYKNGSATKEAYLNVLITWARIATK